MEYEFASELVRLRMLEELMRQVLHGILLVGAGGMVLLLGLCVSEQRLPRRRPSTGPSPDRREMMRGSGARAAFSLRSSCLVRVCEDKSWGLLRLMLPAGSPRPGGN
jgi:hypothetical protein